MSTVRFMTAILSVFCFLCQISASDCPADKVYYPDLDTTSATYGDTVETGLCACLDFGPSLTVTDSTLTLTILLIENEPLRAFQFEIIDNTSDALVLRSVTAGDKIEEWFILGTETSGGNGLVIGFSLSGEETEPGSMGKLLEVSFDIVGFLKNEVSFHLGGGSGGVLLADADAQNVACSYPDSETSVLYPTDWLATAKSKESLPEEYALKQNFPNPFNSKTTIEFDLKSITFVEISVYNLLGREVRKLVKRVMPAGRFQIRWDGRDQSGANVASGIYIYVLKTDSFFEQKKMVLLR